MKRYFGSSGVRGVVGEFITTDLAMKLGLGLATQLGEGSSVVIGRDTRTSGEMLENAFVSGLLSGGCNAELIGIFPTPGVAYLTNALNKDAGIMITASHNPPPYNGFKFFSKNGIAFLPEMEQRLEEILISDTFTFSNWERIGTVKNINSTSPYLSMLNDFSFNKKWRVVLDPGCGAASVVAPLVFRNVGCDVLSINAQVDGHFPARQSEPTPENLSGLMDAVSGSGADIGIAYDGDGDRMVAIDEQGNFAPSDKLLALFARFSLTQEKDQNREKIVALPINTSDATDEHIRESGGKVIRTKVGDVYISQALLKHNGIFGGEPIGAWIHPQYHLCPDGILSSLLLLKLLDEMDSPLSTLIKRVPERIKLRLKIECKNEHKSKVMEFVKKKLPDQFDTTDGILHLDGIRIDLKNGWLLIRPSGTEPFIRITAEAKEQTNAEKILEIGKKVVEEALTII
ncbi:MAG: phosphoglucosamine mutase [Candidatus Sifarchaeia archaeon]|jgi:phosphoglucosamine mutase